MTVSFWTSEFASSSLIFILRFCESCGVLSTTVNRSATQLRSHLENFRILSSLAPPRNRLHSRDFHRGAGDLLFMCARELAYRDKVPKVRTLAAIKTIGSPKNSRSPAPQSNVLSGKQHGCGARDDSIILGLRVCSLLLLRAIGTQDAIGAESTLERLAPV
jgi:hypothetical protein